MPKEPKKPQALKPRLFIGSAGQSKDVANKLQERLAADVEATVWDQGIFQIGDYTLERLLEILGAFDFGAFIFTPDDVANIRKHQFKVTRDNVILELGLFLGKLGRRRCFVIVPTGVEKLHLPTDLLGLNFATYDANRSDENLGAALNPASVNIREIVKKLGRLNPVAEGAAKHLVEEFKLYLSTHAVEKPPDPMISKRKLSVRKLPTEPVPPIGNKTSEKKRLNRPKRFTPRKK